EQDALHAGAGLTKRHKTLWKLAMGDFGILLPYMCITVLLWLIEIIPVSAKFSMLINGQLVTYEVAMGALRKEKEDAIEQWSAEKKAEHDMAKQISKKVAETYQKEIDDSVKVASVLNSVRKRVEEIVSSAVRHIGDLLSKYFTPSTKSTDDDPLVSSPVGVSRSSTFKRWTARTFAIGSAVFVATVALATYSSPDALEQWEAVKVVAGSLFAVFELIFLVVDIRHR
ncbi:MAG: hypothetical protein AABX82_06260, partial [Nanoarchaeota archaeon]